MPKLYIADNGEWKPVKEIHVGKNGAYVPEKIRLVAAKGKWRESYNNEGIKNTNKILDIHELNFRGGNKFQGDLKINGYGLTDVLPVDPPLGAFYTFRSTLRGYFDNFGKADIYGTELPLPAETDGIPCYALDAAKKQYMTANITTRGFYDFLGLVGNDSAWGHWELGGKFKPSAWPDNATDTVCIYYTADSVGSVAVLYDGAGSLYGIVSRKNKFPSIVKIANAVKLDQWTGFCFRHKSGGELTLMLHDRRRAVKQLATSYWKPTPMKPIYMGYGFGFSQDRPADAFFMASNTHSDMTIVDSGLTLYMDKLAYRASQPSGDMKPNTGKYYLECFHGTSYNMHIGVAEPGAPLDVGPGVNGWAVDTIKGNKFDHQTGGGSAWSSKIPDNSTIGILYDSDAGNMRVFVNGVERPAPFPAGTITVPVRFIIGGTGKGGGELVFNPRINLDPSTWAHTPAGEIKPVPLQTIPGGGFGQVETYFTGYLSDFFIRSTPMISEERIFQVINPKLKFSINFENIATGDVYNASSSIIIQKGEHVIMTIPDVPAGNYWIYADREGMETSTKKFFTVAEFQQDTKGFDLNFDTSSIEDIRKHLIVAHKAWGGLNGGVVQENVVINQKNGYLELTSLGNDYTGPVKGVDRVGEPSGYNKRIGACVATREYHGPGSYRVLCTFPQLEGVCSAFWTFHYEEGYPGSKLFNDHLADGLHISGVEAEGFYTVRNHEIDIEVPTALKTNPDQEDVAYTNARFNTWHGELRNWDVPNKDVPTHDPMYSPTNDPNYWSEYTDDFVNHGVALNDGKLHEVRFDWHLGTDPRVEYYVDGVLKHTVRTHVPDIPGRFWVGLWFPSADTHWAGRDANWVSQVMKVKRIQIIPFADEIPSARQITETYPWDVYRDFENIIYE
ncbi:putative glycosyl hydrolase [Vibrio phage pVco-14]|nr:putative glycosyl hydrolase [Vibrio phage pVco-14]